MKELANALGGLAKSLNDLADHYDEVAKTVDRTPSRNGWII